MGDVIVMPDVDPARIRPQPTSMDDLHAGEHALVVVADTKGYAIEVRPGEPHSPRRAMFDRRRDALHFARRTAASHPALYRLVLDETAEGCTSLDRIIGPGPDPMGVGGAA